VKHEPMTEAEYMREGRYRHLLSIAAAPNEIFLQNRIGEEDLVKRCAPRSSA
jgi:hypothetical protein